MAVRSVVAGTAGHIDHGKTELVRALTGINPDRLKEEQERGITIDIGFAHLAWPDLRLAFVDVPGHERFVKNMLAGASGIDLVMLVVSADESVMPQTREHFDICRLLGVSAGLIALTKCDLADAEMRELAALEVREFVRGSFLERAPLVPVSARTGEGLEELKRALHDRALEIPSRGAGGIPRLPVDRSFSVRGFGTVVTGTLASGALRVGQDLEIAPGGAIARIRGLQVHGEDVPEAVAGQRTAVNLQGIAASEIVRGQSLIRPEALRAGSMLDASVRVLSDAPAPLKDLSRVRFHAGTSEILARVRVLGAPAIPPGGEGLVQLRLEAPALATPGERFILRRYSPARTIAGGIVLDAAPRKHRREETGLAPKLARLGATDAAERIRVFLDEAGENGTTLPTLASRAGLTAEDARALLAGIEKDAAVVLLPGDPPRAIAPQALAGLVERLAAALEAFHREEPLHPGIAREALRGRTFPGGPPEVFRGALDALAASGRARVEKDLVASAGHRVALDPGQQELRERLEARFAGAGLDPPGVEEVLGGEGRARGAAERILHLLQKEGILARLPDGRLIHRSALEELRSRLLEFRKTREVIDIAAFKDLAGVSRKNAIPLLELLDSERITVRRGNERIILPGRQERR